MKVALKHSQLIEQRTLLKAERNTHGVFSQQYFPVFEGRKQDYCIEFLMLR